MLKFLIENYIDSFIDRMKGNPKKFLTLKEEEEKFFKLLESRVVNDEAIQITNELIDALNNSKSDLMQMNNRRYVLNNYQIKTDNIFLSSLNLIVDLYSSDGDDYGEFVNPPDNENIFDENNKLINCTIRLRVFNAKSINYRQIAQLLMHELTHMFRFHQIMISGNQDRIDNENKRKDDYNIAYNLNKQIGTNIAKVFWNVYYTSEEDEINSRTSEIYPFIMSRKGEINRNTIGKYFFNLPGVNELKALEDFYTNLETQSDYVKQQFGMLYDGAKNLSAANPKITPLKSYELFIRRLVYGCNKYANQIMKITERALMEIEEERRRKVESYGNDIMKILNEIRNFNK